MDLNQILEILEYILILVIGGLGIYFKHSAMAQKKAKEVQIVISEIMANSIIFIKEAEEHYRDISNAGGKKFEEVVDKLYDLVPDALKGIIQREMVENIVQGTFDEIETYVSTQIDKKLKETK